MKTLLFVFSISIFHLNAQLLTEVYSPYSTINPTFLGTDYQISNVNYIGFYENVGVFNGVGTNIGLDHGILLSTGMVSCFYNPSICGPNNQNNYGFDANSPGFPLLSSMIGGNATFDASVIEFDIIPLIDSIGLKYIFGSEEYPEYVGTQFNDVFGIFISGPGITGTQNISKLPNGQFVSINTVNMGNPANGTPSSNSSLFVNNGDGSTGPFNQYNGYIQFDGYTKPLVAYKKGLTIGATYHITIAVADVNDGVFDSGVFIERCSTCSFTLSLNEMEKTSKKIIGIYDVFGREVEEKPNTLQFYLFSDGSVEKIFKLD